MGVMAMTTRKGLKEWLLMRPPKRKRRKSVKYNSDEVRNISDEGYEYDHRHKPMSMGFNNTSECDGGYQSSAKLIVCYDSTGIHTINRKPVIMNGEKSK